MHQLRGGERRQMEGVQHHQQLRENVKTVRTVWVGQHSVPTPLGRIIRLLFGANKIDHNIEILDQVSELVVVFMSVVHLNRRLRRTV